MSHFAHINSDNIVDSVIVAEQDVIDTFYNASEWIQTSYNTVRGVHILGGTPLRKNYAGIGYSYDSVLDAFIPPRPYPSWVLDTQECYWLPPIPVPTDGNRYSWNESSLTWEVDEV